MTTIRQNILVKLAHSQIEEALALLFLEMKKSKETWEDLILLSSQYYRITEGYNNGTLKYEELNINLNILTGSLTKLTLKRTN